MDKIAKSLAKFSEQEKKATKEIVLKIVENTLEGLDVKKLKNHSEIFRVRKVKIRIIFRRAENGQIDILVIERQPDWTYSNF